MTPADDREGETDDGAEGATRDAPDGPLERVAESPLTLPLVVAGGLVAVALLTGGLPVEGVTGGDLDPAPEECAPDCPDPGTWGVLPPDTMTRVLTCHACSCTGCGNVTQPPTTTAGPGTRTATPD